MENPVRCLDPLVLAVISPVPTFKRDAESNMVRYQLNAGRHAPPEIIDVKDVDCLVGHARTPQGDWYVLDRTSVVGRVNFLETLAHLTKLTSYFRQSDFHFHQLLALAV